MKVKIIFSSLCIIVALGLSLGCSSTPGDETAGEFFDSSLITATIKSQLVDDPVTSGFRIKVETHKGIVQLSGFVNTRAEKQRAEEIAEKVAGVTAVSNDIIVSH